MEMNRAVGFAGAVAAMLVAAACSSKDESVSRETPSSTSSALVKCEGVNECKGTSECKSADGKSGCQGLNECKGQGWVTVPEADCAKKGGTVLRGETASAPAAPTADAAVAVAEDASHAPMAEASAVKCEGINECKGTSDCAAKDGSSSCKGMNECKGHGWVTVPSADECATRGGHVQA